jgi:hypothetical protein
MTKHCLFFSQELTECRPTLESAGTPSAVQCGPSPAQQQPAHGDLLTKIDLVSR